MTEEIKQRIEMINRGEVPKGYIHTREGIFPDHWEIKQINKWIKLCERTIKLQDEMSYELITVRRAYKGVDSRGNFLGKEILVKNYFLVHNFDFVISKRQIAHGACGIVPKELDNAVVSNEYNVFIAQDSTDINMFNLMMQLPHYNRLFYLMSDGVHIEKLLFKTNDWLKRTLAMPPLPEQEKIAEILTTQDKVIELKQKLINEKKQQKKWLMQQLLTGKKRLKGFSGEWKKVRLGEHLSEKNIRNKDLKVIDVKSVNNKLGFINQEEQFGKSVASKDLSNYKIVSKGTIAYNPSRINVGSIALYNEDYEGIVSPMYVVMKVKKGLFEKYLMYYVATNEFSQKMKSLISGSVRDTLNYSDLCCMHFCLPPLREQTAIAEILSTQDKEIELLEKDLEQEKQKKKALMQLLLTGKVRVK